MLPSNQPEFDLAAVEASLGTIRGVSAVRIVVSPTQQIDEVHIVGSPVRSPKQVVRDVCTILLVQHRVRLDHRKVSLVQIDVAPPALARIVLQSVTIDDGELPTVNVLLSWQGQDIIGIGRARSDQPVALSTLAGYATIHALDQILPPRVHLALEQLEVHQIKSHNVCVAYLSLTEEASVDALFGISVIAHNAGDAAARAVLDAVNRRILRLFNR